MFWYALVICGIGAIVLGVMAYVQSASALDDTPEGRGKTTPAERFRALSLEDSPWGRWRPVVAGAGVWLWLCTGIALPLYCIYVQGVPIVHGMLWLAIVSPVIAGGTMALLLLVDLSAMIAGIGAGEVGTTPAVDGATPPAAGSNAEGSENSPKPSLSLPLQ